MIQFNLLPDVKLEYIKARRQKRMVIMLSTIVAGSSLFIMVLLYIGVAVIQKNSLTNLSEDIQKTSKQLSATPDLDKILTVQNQLTSLPGLNDQKPVVTRLFPYIQQFTPRDVTISNLEVDFDAMTIKVEGGASALVAVNKFADTLKFTDFQATQDKQIKHDKRAFSGVVLSSFSQDEKGTRYEITLSFDPVIFDSTFDVKLDVPVNQVTTRSATERPKFDAPSNAESEEQ